MRTIEDKNEAVDSSPEVGDYIKLTYDNLHLMGVNVLTSEACPYGLRLLCDVSMDGSNLLQEMLAAKLTLQPNWNTMVGSKPAVGSVLLSRGTLNDYLRFSSFAMGAKAIVEPTEAIGSDSLAIFSVSRLKDYEAYNATRIKNVLTESGLNPGDATAFYSEPRFKQEQDRLFRIVYNPQSEYKRSNTHVFSGMSM